jgi:hypothetical protein
MIVVWKQRIKNVTQIETIEEISLKSCIAYHDALDDDLEY